jgi:phosphatidylserine decarboxylase
MMQINKITNMIHKEGYNFIFIALAITVFALFSNKFLAVFCLLGTIGCALFFRNPERVTPINDDFVISPADGVIRAISQELPPAELKLGDEKMTKISIFLSVLDVHVNRVPMSGKVIGLNYNPGKFLNASLDKSSIHNERQSVLLETVNGNKIVFVQIAGLIARRIVCDLEEGQEVKAGARFGIIRFGSRMDVYLHSSVNVRVAKGQYAIGGETILAVFGKNNDEPMQFEVR